MYLLTYLQLPMSGFDACYYYYLKSNDLSDTITRQQLRGHLTKKHR